MLAKADGDLLQALQSKLVKVEDAPEKAWEQPIPTVPTAAVLAIEAPTAPAEPGPAPEHEPTANDDGDEESDEVFKLSS